MASKRRARQLHLARFLPERGPVADYLIVADRPAHEAPTDARFIEREPSRIVMHVPFIANGPTEESPAQYIEAAIELCEESAQQLIEHMQRAIDFVAEPFESEAVKHV